MTTLELSVRGCIPSCDNYGEPIGVGEIVIIKIKDEYVDDGYPETIEATISAVFDIVIEGIQSQKLGLDYDETLLPSKLNRCHLDGTPVCKSCCEKNSDRLAEIESDYLTSSSISIEPNPAGGNDLKVNGVTLITLT